MLLSTLAGMDRCSFSFAAIFLLFSSHCSLIVLSRDIDAMGSFKDGLIDPKGATANWDATLYSPCTWFRVECNSQDEVTAINVFAQGLSGTLSSKLGDLRSLETLFLSDNNLTGSIPVELGNLANLKRLDLSNNSFSGSIPSELGNLLALRRLQLNNNKLSGNLPATLGGISSLVLLNVSHNSLTGSIPTCGILANFKDDSFSNNNFCIPANDNSCQAAQCST